ncbi:histidine kinase [Flavihumibacter rivuli]|uniref:sensor histidine kinase n=1 Tax=Flavihumibacter rivuli TaxID=2838156 RepID=UPI001BDE0400|nr:histidine kinase [Flavihumibacter rivuli]ULQ55945.1 histidine kinase [Flavihumibacter rivuli]
MNERKIRTWLPLILLVFILLFFYGIYIRDLKSGIQIIALSFFYSLASCETARWLALTSRLKHPGLALTRKRLRYMALISIPFLVLVPMLDEAVTFLVGFFTVDNLKWGLLFRDYLTMVGLNLLCTVIVVAVYEGIYYIENWKKLYDESEQLKKITLNSQFQFLKEQIKPHFLFNSLNTLTSLIGTDPERAEQFAVEMSSVYRYLLTNQDKELSTVKEELDFLHSYIHLLKTRFADSLQVNIRIPEREYQMLIPPLVLQLLVENAVKHNIVSRDRPLFVSIETDGEHSLIVTNNIQRKANPEPSEKTGLNNLITRYQLLKMDNQLSITDNDQIFKVVLPLIESSIYQSLGLPKKDPANFPNQAS